MAGIGCNRKQINGGQRRMDSAYIFGSFRFAGFHLCNKLLEKGWEVAGIDLSVDEKDAIAEEKKLEIGRNANFREMELNDIPPDYPFEQLTAVIVSFYDLFMENQDFLVSGHILHDHFLEMFRCPHEKEIWPVFLLPIQFLDESEQCDLFIKIRLLLKECTLSSENAQFFYLPSMFGEWQPSSYFVQAALQKKLDIQKKNEREWMNDLIYIQDAISMVVDTMESGKAGTFLLNSGKTNYWEECLEVLGIPDNEFSLRDRTVPLDNLSARRLSIPNPTPLEVALSRQKEHNELISKGRI